MPYVYGQDNIFNIKDADAIVMSDKAIPEMAEGEPDEIKEKISDRLSRSSLTEPPSSLA